MYKFFKIVVRFAIVAGIVVLVIGVLTLFVPEYRRICGLDVRCRQLRAQVEAKQREIHTLRTNQARLLGDPEFVARIAHQNRRVFPNEVVFVFDDK